MIGFIEKLGRSLKGKFALTMLLVFFFIAVFGPYLTIDPSQIPQGATPYMAPGHELASSGKRVLFGTDQIGRDVFSGVIHGARWALIVGVFSTFLSVLIGVFFGAIAGYFGDTFYKSNVWALSIWVLVAVLGLFYIFYSRWGLMTKWGVAIIGLAISYYGIVCLIGKSARQKPGILHKRIKLPLDSITLRSIEMWRAIPGLFVLLAILAAVKSPTIWTAIIAIGVLRWTGIARLLRAELLLVREQNYIRSAQAVGFSHLRILMKHAFPNAVRPLFVVCAFSISTAIILEATLSFLGIGLTADYVTWGSLMSAARENYRAWWLAVFPGLCIFMLVFSLNIIGDVLSEDT